MFGLALWGAYLRGQPLNADLLISGQFFVQQTRTAPQYRLFVLPDTSPAKPWHDSIRKTADRSKLKSGELGAAALGKLVAAVPPPLVIGNVQLASGEWIKGFLCEEVTLKDAREITSTEAGAPTWLPSSHSLH